MLVGLQYHIVYKKGVDNHVADALSHKSSYDAHCLPISTSSPQWITEIVDGYMLDPATQSIIAKLAIDFVAVPEFSLHGALLSYKGRLWIGANPTLKQKLIRTFHDTALGAHLGVLVTYMRLKQLRHLPASEAK